MLQNFWFFLCECFYFLVFGILLVFVDFFYWVGDVQVVVGEWSYCVVVEEQVMFVVGFDVVIGVEVFYMQIDWVVLWIVNIGGCDYYVSEVCWIQYWEINVELVVVKCEVRCLYDFDVVGQCGIDWFLIYQIV